MKVALLLLALAAFSPAVAANDYVVDFDRRVDFSALRTFSFRNTRVGIDRPEISNPLVIARTTATVRAALASRGLQEVADDADLLVDWTVTSQSFFVNEWGHAIPLPAAPRASGPETFLEGVLVIDMTQASSGLLVWRGVLRDRQKDAARLAQKLSVYAKKLLARYPRVKS